MKCKYCGNNMVQGKFCPSSPIKKCVGIPDGVNCSYCSQKFVANGFCPVSPSKKHQLSS